jgi:hypothetical protein
MVHMINAYYNDVFLDEYDSLVPNDVNKMLDMICVDVINA